MMGSSSMSRLRNGFGFLPDLISSSTKSKERRESMAGTTNLATISANVFPRQIRLPPIKGLKANGLRFWPSGLRKYGDYGSNLSGIYFSGEIHSSGSF